MARYRKIDPRIWNDEKFRLLTDDGKLSFLYLLTHPHLTAIGAMRASVDGLSKELGWPMKRFAKPFAELLRNGFLEFDKTASCVVLKNFLKYNRPDNPNQVKAWSSSIDYIPECKLKVELVERLKRFAEQLGKRFAEGFAKAFPKPFRNGLPNHEQEQEQEQEQEKEQEQEQEEKKSKPPASSPSANELIAIWCEEFKKKRGTNPIITGRIVGTAKRLVDVLKPDETTRELFRRYLDDGDPWLTKQGHPFTALESRLDAYRIAPETNPQPQWKQEKEEKQRKFKATAEKVEAELRAEGKIK